MADILLVEDKDSLRRVLRLTLENAGYSVTEAIDARAALNEIATSRHRLVLTGAARRRTFGEYKATNPSRFLEEVPPDLIEQASDYSSEYQRSFGGSSLASRGQNPYRRGGAYPSRVRETSAPFVAYEDEDQSAGTSGGIVPGARVRHAQFGVGTVISAP